MTEMLPSAGVPSLLIQHLSFQNFLRLVIGFADSLGRHPAEFHEVVADGQQPCVLPLDRATERRRPPESKISSEEIPQGQLDLPRWTGIEYLAKRA
jgi:hypothetical protein